MSRGAATPRGRGLSVKPAAPRIRLASRRARAANAASGRFLRGLLGSSLRRQLPLKLVGAWGSGGSTG
jgi:hypothetical protein